MTTHTQAKIEALADRMRKEALARSNYTGYFDEKLTQDMMVSAGLLYALAAAARAPGDGHASDCATHNMPASPNGPCDCGALAATDGAEAFQARVRPWMLACFNETIMADVVERCDRFIEEALELCQANGWPAERAHALVDYVYGRDQGDINQEVGGVMVTLAALCLAIGVDMHEAGETELARVWTKIDKIRAKQASKPTGSALPIAAPPAPEVKAEYEIIGTTYDGVDILAPAVKSKNFSVEEIRKAVRLAVNPAPEVKAEARAEDLDEVEAEIKRLLDPAGRSWRCFHCEEVFTTEESAREHFGPDCTYEPACKIDIAEYRRMEEVHQQHINETDEASKTFHSMRAEHSAALRREEERGYEKGLRDGQKLANHPYASGADLDRVSRLRDANGNKIRDEAFDAETAFDPQTGKHWLRPPPAPSQELSAAEMREAAAKVARDWDDRNIMESILRLPLTQEPSVS